MSGARQVHVKDDSTGVTEQWGSSCRSVAQWLPPGLHQLRPSAQAEENIWLECTGTLLVNQTRSVTDTLPAACIGSEVSVWGACVKAFVYEKVEMTPNLFLVRYTEFCLCVMPLCSWDRQPGRQQQQRAPRWLRLCSLTLTLRLLHQWERLTRFLGGGLREAICKKETLS